MNVIEDLNVEGMGRRGRVKKVHLSRSARVFHCDSCGLVIDRDLNAAKNLAALA